MPDSSSNPTPPPIGFNNPNPPAAPGSQSQSTTPPSLPGMNKPNPPSISGRPGTPGASSVPDSWNQMANVMQMILQVFIKEGPAAAERLKAWVEAELQK